MSLTINNETDWDGRHLRTLCRAVIERIDGEFNRTIDIRISKASGKEWRWERIESEGGTRGLYRGRASPDSRRYCYMGVPYPARKVNGRWLRHEFDPEQFARVLEHELFHQLGLRHGEMNEAVQYCRQSVPYAEEFEVRPKPSWEFPGE